MGRNMNDLTTGKEKISVFFDDEDESSEILCEQNLEAGIPFTEAVGNALYEMSLGQRTVIDGAKFLLTVGVSRKERSPLREMVKRHECRECIQEHDGKCVEGHSEEWVKKILGSRGKAQS
jgi:hypothetical protein